VRQDGIDVGAIVDVRPHGGRCQRRLDDQVLGYAEVRTHLAPPGRICLPQPEHGCAPQAR
jgi:hypothetical protein